MDNASLRRGKPTIYKNRGINTAILTGDAIFAKSIELLMYNSQNINNGRILKDFSICAQNLCEGQALDLEFENNNMISEKEYIKMVSKKTGALLGFSMKLGRMLNVKRPSQENLSQEKILFDCGENLGIAFQIQDDLLDVFASKSYDNYNFNPYKNNENKFGKNIGGDIILNKTTFLTVTAYQLANSSQKKHLDMWFSIKYKDEDKVKAIISIFNDLKIKKSYSTKD